MGIQALADKFEGARGKLFAGATAAAVAIPLAFGGLVATANDAYAQDASIQTISTSIDIASPERVGELLGDAAGYGFSGEGIGVVVLIGDDLRSTGKPLEYFANGFETLFDKQGVNAVAYAAHIDSPYSGFEFYTATQKFGQFDLGTAMQTIPKAASLSLEEKTLNLSSLERDIN